MFVHVCRAMARPSPPQHAPRYFGAPRPSATHAAAPCLPYREKPRGPRPAVVRTSQGRLSVAVAVAVALWLCGGSTQDASAPAPRPAVLGNKARGGKGWLAGWLRGVVARYPPPHPSVCFNRVCRV